ncbi:ArsR/SmtB family transcription factor [Fangia hongkongensis]|uniref:ArsR/SmtB family transcription factor n=2 Tax=Fangia hongkongensis TaxID=270495 RepID=UPI00035FD622|nr:helix-turn-helix domain-containing protein [Fangia hongkongensis]
MSLIKNLGSMYQTELYLKAFKALSNPDRFNIVQWLLEPKKNFFSEKVDIEKEGVTINMIMQKVGLSQSVTSQHIQQLEDAGIVTCERKAQFRMCKVNKSYTKQLFESLADLF